MMLGNYSNKKPLTNEDMQISTDSDMLIMNKRKRTITINF